MGYINCLIYVRISRYKYILIYVILAMNSCLIRRECQKLLQPVAAAGTDRELSTEARDNLISDNLHRAEALFE